MRFSGAQAQSETSRDIVGLTSATGAATSHYDPTRTKKIYSEKSQELQRWIKELWDRWAEAAPATWRNKADGLTAG
jgi:hypothetical protein